MVKQNGGFCVVCGKPTGFERSTKKYCSDQCRFRGRYMVRPERDTLVPEDSVRTDEMVRVLNHTLSEASSTLKTANQLEFLNIAIARIGRIGFNGEIFFVEQ